MLKLLITRPDRLFYKTLCLLLYRRYIYWFDAKWKREKCSLFLRYFMVKRSICTKYLRFLRVFFAWVLSLCLSFALRTVAQSSAFVNTTYSIIFTTNDEQNCLQK
jgi:hypothetical protein